MTFTSYFSISSTINLLMASTKSRKHKFINKESPKKIGVALNSSKTFYYGIASMALYNLFYVDYKLIIYKVIDIYFQPYLITKYGK